MSHFRRAVVSMLLASCLWARLPQVYAEDLEHSKVMHTAEPVVVDNLY